jgi:23S rRNA pseudouridine955/2504/2580 synthase
MMRAAEGGADPDAAGTGAVRTIEVAEVEAGSRLDRWFKRHYPNLSHGRIEKLLRTGQIRVDGRRVKAGLRLTAGMRIRVPPIEDAPAAARKTARTREPSRQDAARLRALVLYKDDDVIAIDKPPGLAVQGGTKTLIHLDAMLDALKLGNDERPRLVHRLDKDSSGVLILARNAAAASRLAASFRRREARKTYWAITVGVPSPREGKVDLALAKLPGRGGERMVADTDAGKRAITYYSVIETAGRTAAFLALSPLTGRTHQLRAHCAHLGTPILGDGKYGAKAAFLAGRGVSRKLHLHALSLSIPHPRAGRIDVTAPLPAHMVETFALFGFDAEAEAARDPFAGGEGYLRRLSNSSA